MKLKTIVLAAVMVVAVAASGCAAASPTSHSASDSGVHGEMDHANMANTATGDAFDLQFIDGMIAHHEGAVAMAEQALDEGEHAELRALADEIIAAQAQEIEEMSAWREAWFADAEPTPIDDLHMGAMAIESDASKPFDLRFIEAMISHHEGAIDMAESALEMSDRDEIRSLASRIISDQQAEIEMMRAWQQEWYGAGN